MILPGLVSITFRKLSVREIVELVRKAGLAGIEWGGDVHVPHGDVKTAREVRALTEDAGLRPASYGAYYRAGESESEGLTFGSVLRTAVALGAPVIRVWAGKTKEVNDPEYRARVVADSRRIADLAAAEGIAVAYEYHQNTLTSTNESAAALLREVAHENVKTYWQRIHEDVATCMDGLEAVLPHVCHVHVNYMRPGSREKLPLAEGGEPWVRYLRAVSGTGGTHFALIEFVAGNEPEAFLADAATLTDWLRRVQYSDGNHG